MAKKEMSKILVIVAIILAILILFSMKPGLKIMSGGATAVGLTGSITEGGTIDCGVTIANITFTGSRGTTVTASQTPQVYSKALGTSIDATGQATDTSNWFYSGETSNWILQHSLNMSTNTTFVDENVAFSGGTVGTNKLAKAGAPNINITEPLIFKVYFPADAYAKNYTATYTITCSANALNLNGVNLTFKNRNVPYNAVTTLNPDTQYDALLTNTLSGGVPIISITALEIAGTNGNIMHQTIVPGGCADLAYAGNNICARFTYNNGTTLIVPGAIYGKAVGTTVGSADVATAVIPAVST